MSLKLEAEVRELKDKLSFVESILASWGIQGRWVSIKQAATLLSVKPWLIEDAIGKAEKNRAIGKRSSLVYGTHYRSIAPSDSQRPLWQVNYLEFQNYLNMPPELKD